MSLNIDTAKKANNTIAYVYSNKKKSQILQLIIMIFLIIIIV